MRRRGPGHLERSHAAGLTINTSGTSPIDIPSNRSAPASQGNSVESDRFDMNVSFEDISSDCLSRSIGTQTPTSSLSFDFPIPNLMPDIPESSVCTPKRNPGLYGQHSFREERESSWFTVSNWFRLSSNSNSSESRFSRNSRIRQSIAITSPPTPRPRPRSMSSSSVNSYEDLEEVGKQLRSIGDEFDRLGLHRQRSIRRAGQWL